MIIGKTAFRIFSSVLLFALAISLPARAEPTDEQIQQWRDQLSSEDRELRTMAVLSLLDANSPEAINALREILNQTDNSTLKVSIIRAIAHRNDDRFVDETIGLLDSPQSEVVEAAVLALKDLQSDQVRLAMVEALTDDNYSVRARKKLADILAEIREFRAMDPLINLLDDENTQMTLAALTSLKKLTMRDFGFDQAGWQTWWDTWRERPRSALLEEIIRIQGETINETRSKTASLWIELIRFTETAESPRAQELLAEGIESDLPSVKTFAIRKLAEKRAEGWTDTVIPLASSIYPEVRIAVAETLARAGVDKAEAPLKQLLTDLDPKVAAKAANSLGELKATGATGDLIKLLEETSGEPAARAAHALGRIENPEAVQSLSRTLLDHNRQRDVREEAAVALGRIRTRQSMESLLQVLEAPDNRIRWSAAESLGRLGYEDSVNALGKMLSSDASPQVREIAAIALGNIGSRNAVPFLLQGLDDAERRVSDQAGAALFTIMGTDQAGYEKIASDLLDEGRYRRAARLCRITIERFERDENRNNNLIALRKHLARAHISLEQWNEAIETFERLLALEPDNEEFHKDLIDVCARAGNHEALLKNASNGIKRAPGVIEQIWAQVDNSINSLLEARKPNPIIEFVNQFGEEALGGLPGQIRDNIPRYEQRARELAESIQEEEKQTQIEALGGDDEASRNAYDKLLASAADAVPHLIEQGLSSDNRDIRNFSIELLEKITGQNFDIPENATDNEIRQGINLWIERWRAANRNNANLPQ